MLLVSVWWRLLAAGIAVARLWGAVLWVAPSTPTISSAETPVRVAAPTVVVRVIGNGGLRAVVQSGFPAPGGGRFDRFDVAAHPVAAPVNARGQVAFYATVLRSPAREGIFIAEGGQVRKLAAFGDNLSGGGTLAEFGAHPLPSLNAAGHGAFVAHIAGGRATEGVFLAAPVGVQTIAREGDDAPGMPGGGLLRFEAPLVIENEERAFGTVV